MKPKKIHPPRLAIWLFDRIARSDEIRTINGDMTEMFSDIAEESGSPRARLWFWKQVLVSMLVFLGVAFRSSGSLFVNYAKVCLRFFRKHRIHASINVIGLALGISASLLIFLFVMDELSFDRFHENGDNLYRVVRERYENDSGEVGSRSPYLPPPTGPALLEQLEAIDCQTGQMWARGVVQFEDHVFTETFQLVSEDFFRMFSFPLLAGQPETALAEENCVVLTEPISYKYFGGSNAVGQTLTITFGQVQKDFLVTGVSERPPANSSIQFDMLIPMSNLPLATNDPPILDNWQRWYFPLYVKLREDVSPQQIEDRLDAFCAQAFGPEIERSREDVHWTREGLPFTLRFQPLKSIYLETRGLGPSLILSGIALIILVIAWINFINISMGLSASRSMEVGLRKVVGAERRDLMIQFWTEALLMSLLAIVAGMILTALFLPKFNQLSGKQLSFSSFFSGVHLAGLVGLSLISGFAAGSTPAMLMSGFRPADIIKGKCRIGGKAWKIRLMVILQFSLAVLLVISSILMGKQARFLVRKDLGYKEEGLVVVMTQENEQSASEDLYFRYRNRIITHSRVKGMTACNREFGLFLPGTALDSDDGEIHYRYTRVDPYFISTMGFKVIQGRDFNPSVQSDAQAVIVNERFIQALGAKFTLDGFLHPAGKGFPAHNRVIGVIEDGHFRSLRSEIEPLLLYTGKGFSPARDRFSRMIIRIDAEGILETRKFLEEAWREIQPDKPFVMTFQADALENQYARERRWSTIVEYSSVFSVLIACLGILGLTSIIISKRTKEIGIRKVFGARSSQIVSLVISEFIILVGLANLLAWPTAYFVMKHVLQNYPYRANLSLWVFLLTGLGTVMIAILTIGYISVKAALSNPVRTLRYE